jgi:hypothetical protein
MMWRESPLRSALFKTMRLTVISATNFLFRRTRSIVSVMRQKSLCFDCHSGLDQACPVLDTGESRRRPGESREPFIPLIPIFIGKPGFPLEFTPYLIRGGNDGLRNNVKKCWTQYIRNWSETGGFGWGHSV